MVRVKFFSLPQLHFEHQQLLPRKLAVSSPLGVLVPGEFMLLVCDISAVGDFPTIGGSTLSLIGTNFGSNAPVIDLTVGPYQCNSPTQTDTLITCTISEGIGVDLPLRLDIWNQVRIIFGSDPPSTSSLI